MEDLILVLVPFAIIFFPLMMRAIVKNIEKSSGMNAGVKNQQNRNTKISNGNRPVNLNDISTFAKQPVKGKQSHVSGGESAFAMDDKNNDWLAKQMREEQKSKVIVSEMFQLKMQHHNKCDAEFIKRFHESGCDASGIDTASK